MQVTIPFGFLRTAYRRRFQWSPTFQHDPAVAVNLIETVC